MSDVPSMLLYFTGLTLNETTTTTITTATTDTTTDVTTYVTTTSTNTTNSTGVTNINNINTNYIYGVTVNPITGTTSTSLNETPGIWYYFYSANLVINGEPNSNLCNLNPTTPTTSTTSTTSSTSITTTTTTITNNYTYSIQFDPSSVLPSSMPSESVFMYILGQGGLGGKNGSTYFNTSAYNIYCGGGGGGGGGGQVYLSYLKTTSYAVEVGLYPRSITTNSFYKYGKNYEYAIGVANGAVGSNGDNASAGNGGNAGKGGDGDNQGSGGSSDDYYGGGGGNGGIGGLLYLAPPGGSYSAATNNDSTGDNGDGGTGGTPGGYNGTKGNISTPGGYTAITFADGTTANVGTGGLGGETILNTSTTIPVITSATAGNNPEFMFYFFVAS